MNAHLFKTNMRTIAFVGLLFLGVFAGVDVHAGSDAEAPGIVAVTFINAYVKASYDRNWNPARFIGRSPLVTKSFKRTYAALVAEGFRENPVVGLGSDPVIDGNDCPERYNLKSSKINGENAMVTLVGPKDYPVELKVRLVKVGSQWRVDASGMMLRTSLTRK